MEMRQHFTRLVILWLFSFSFAEHDTKKRLRPKSEPFFCCGPWYTELVQVFLISMRKTEHNVSGFTLIELLITIGILAVLATVTVLVMNPTELFAQARDSQRISDLGTLNKATLFYLGFASDTNLAGDQENCGGATCSCGGYFWATAPGAERGTQFTFSVVVTVDTATLREVNGTGWMPIDFTALADFGGSPLTVLPIDPTNSVSGTALEELVYKYRCNTDNGQHYEINANMESERYSQNGGRDVESNTKDGGNKDEVYEVGNIPGLSL